MCYDKLGKNNNNDKKQKDQFLFFSVKILFMIFKIIIWYDRSQKNVVYIVIRIILISWSCKTLIFQPLFTQCPVIYKGQKKHKHSTHNFSSQSISDY